VLCKKKKVIECGSKGFYYEENTPVGSVEGRVIPGFHREVEERSLRLLPRDVEEIELQRCSVDLPDNLRRATSWQEEALGQRVKSGSSSQTRAKIKQNSYFEGVRTRANSDVNYRSVCKRLFPFYRSNELFYAPSLIKFLKLNTDSVLIVCACDPSAPSPFLADRTYNRQGISQQQLERFYLKGIQVRFGMFLINSTETPMKISIFKRI
jgi:hypothetical protein